MEFDFCRIDDGKFVAYPTHKVMGIVPDGEQVRGAYEALTQAGFDGEKIEVLCGAAAAKMFDTTGEKHGAWAKLVRAVQSFADLDTAHARRHEQELSEGRYVIAVPAADRDTAEQARQILKQHGGYFINYYGQWAVEVLDE